MGKRVYVKGVRNKAVDDNRLVVAYLLLARVLVEQEEHDKQNQPSDTSESAE